MPPSREFGAAGPGEPPLTFWQRMKYTLVRPDDEDETTSPRPDNRSAEDLQESLRRADDRERAVGFIAAPVSAAITFIIIKALIDRDHTPGAKVVASVSTLNNLELVLLGLSVLMLVTAWWRKRLFLGIVLALYGVSLFQLGWLGFAVPFVLAGAWYIVRHFRLQQALRRRESEADDGSPSRAGRPSNATTNGARPRQNKRYTPPT